MDEKQDIGDEQSKPDVIYKKYYHDLLKQYCCTPIQQAIEDIEFIQYCEYYDEYYFSSYDEYPLRRMRYCPYFGKEIESLRTVLSVMKSRYMRRKDGN